MGSIRSVRTLLDFKYWSIDQSARPVWPGMKRGRFWRGLLCSALSATTMQVAVKACRQHALSFCSDTWTHSSRRARCVVLLSSPELIK